MSLRRAAIVLSLLLARTAGGQAVPLSSPPSAAALVAAWPAALRLEIGSLLDSAAIEGLPGAPLRAKIAEGIAKEASPATIIVVVKALAANLRAARSALGRHVTEPELVAAAAALQSGAALDQLRSLRASLRADQSAAQLFVVLTDLTHQGIAATEGVDALKRLARAGAGDAAFLQLRSDVASDVASGVAARTAVTRRTAEYVSRGFERSGAIVPPHVPFEH